MVSDLAATRLIEPGQAPKARPSTWAVATAMVLHAALLIWLLLDWSVPPAPERAPIAVNLVLERPPAPAPPPPPPPPKPEPPRSFTPRESGPDQQTTAPQAAPEPAPEAVAPPPPPPAPEPQPNLAARESGPEEKTTAPPAAEEPAPEAVAPPPPPGPKAPVEHGEAASPPAGAGTAKPPPTPVRTEPRKEATRTEAPQRKPLAVDRPPGEKEETGDPYLNRVWALIERNRQPTTPVGSSGLHLEGITVYDALVDRSGALHALTLQSSSGSPLLDDEARRMIVAAVPFPPLPPEYPALSAIKITIRLFPQ